MDTEACVLCLHALAQHEAEKGCLEEAATLADQAGQLQSDELSTWTRARLSLLRGRIQLRRGFHTDAESDALDSVHLAQKDGLVGLAGDAYYLLAMIARTRGQLSSANVLYANAGRAYWQVGDLSAYARLLLNRATVLVLMGLLGECIRLCEEAARMGTELGRPATTLRAQLTRALAEVRQGHLASARRALVRGAREARRAGLRREEALALEFLGEGHVLAGNLARARVALHLGTELATRLAPRGDVALEIGSRVALLELAEGRVVDAVRSARAAAEHARSAGALIEEAQALRTCAVASLESGRKAAARRSFERARALFEEAGERLERRVVEAWLEALGRPSRGGHLQASRPPAIAKTSGDPALEVPDKALTFWLNHPLLGPNPWLRRKRERQQKRAPRDRFRADKGGHAQLAAARPRTRDWTREGILPRVERPVTEAPTRVTTQPTSGATPAPALSSLWSDLGLVTRTPAVIETLRLAETYAPGRIPILILGATGTGKDLIAQGLHRLSGQPGAYVPVNCAAARREIFVAELFGARRGAYTGAIDDRRGLVEEAERGTLFFDEIADLDAEAQGYLLRFLDAGEIRPLGETRSRRVETRILAATCRDLQARVSSGMFRADLYGRLAGLVLRVPPLGERPEDFEPLITMLWERGGGDPETRAEVFTPHVVAVLRARDWPGNVRELKHVVDRAILFHRSHGVAAARADLLRTPEKPVDTQPTGTPPRLPAPSALGTGPPQPSPWADLPQSIRAAQGDWDPDLLKHALAAAGGVISEAARLLGLSRAHAYRLYKRLKEEERNAGKDQFSDSFHGEASTSHGRPNPLGEEPPRGDAQPH